MGAPARNRGACFRRSRRIRQTGGGNMTKRTLSAIGVSVAIACALYVSDAQAQWFATPSGPGAWYFGPEGGWTGLQGTKTSITGTNTAEPYRMAASGASPSLTRIRANVRSSFAL